MIKKLGLDTLDSEGIFSVGIVILMLILSAIETFRYFG